MEADLFLRGVVIGIAVAAPVGPVNVLCMRRTVNLGPLNGFAAGLGAALADAAFGAIAAFGLTAVTAFLSDQQQWFRLVGGAVLLALGVRIFSARPRPGAPSANQRDLVHAVSATFLLTLSNPMTILGFVAIFAGTGLVGPGTDYVAAGAMVTGVFLGSASWWLALSLAIGQVRHRFDHATLVWINRGSGTLILLFGVGALASVAAGL